MKISKNPGSPPPPPERDGTGAAGKTGAAKAGETAGPQHAGQGTRSKRGNPAEAAAGRSRAAGNEASQLMKQGGSAVEFATIGLNKLMQAATGRTQAGAQAKPADEATGGARTERAWDNVAGAIFGPAEPVAAKMQSHVASVAEHVKAGAFDEMKASTSQAAQDAAPGDINAFVQSVLRESYMETTKDLQFYAEKVTHFNSLKEGLRDQISDARKELHGQLQSVGEDAQLANVDLQNVLQKQQQTMQMMSNIAKSLHDTAMAVVRKIGG